MATHKRAEEMSLCCSARRDGAPRQQQSIMAHYALERDGITRLHTFEASKIPFRITLYILTHSLHIGVLLFTCVFMDGGLYLIQQQPVLIILHRCIQIGDDETKGLIHFVQVDHLGELSKRAEFDEALISYARQSTAPC